MSEIHGKTTYIAFGAADVDLSTLAEPGDLVREHPIPGLLTTTFKVAGWWSPPVWLDTPSVGRE